MGLEKTAVQANDEDKYKIDDAVSALMKAEEVKADKELYAKAQAKMKEKMGHMNKVMGTSDMRKKAKVMETMEGEE